MAFPTLYFDTGGAATNSGSSDSNSPDLSGSAATVSGTTVTLDGTPDLSGLAADGSETIYLNDATNANRKIFRIVGADNGAKTVEVDVAPTGITSTSWAIGGRFLVASGSYDSVISGAFSAGWLGVFNNSPASHSGSDFIVARNGGNATDGEITIRGAAGTRPVLTVTDANQVFFGNSQNNIVVEALEFAQQGGSGAAVIGGSSAGIRYVDLKISDAGGNGFQINSDMVFACEISGVGDNGVSSATSLVINVMGSYIHDNAGDGIEFGGFRAVASRNILDSNGGRGIYLSTTSADEASFQMIDGNTIYGNGNSGVEVADAQLRVTLLNNILLDNGNAGTEYNVEWAAGDAEVTAYHDYNCFSIAGAAGGGNLSGLTANDNELTDDPLFVDAANGDFRLKAGSPARGAGFPGTFLGGPTGYLDIGAVQMQKTLANPVGLGGPVVRAA